MKGVNYRVPRGMPYVRREYISGKPQLKIARFSSGRPRLDYDYKLELIVTENIQIRHNSLEAARLAANKTMATAGEASFFSAVRVYPHAILRENKMIATAGADRLQEGMRRAFGKSTGLAARVQDGQSILIVYVPEDGIETAKKALEVAGTKMPMKTRIIVEAPVAPQIPAGA